MGFCELDIYIYKFEITNQLRHTTIDSQSVFQKI